MGSWWIILGLSSGAPPRLSLRSLPLVPAAFLVGLLHLLVMVPSPTGISSGPQLAVLEVVVTPPG